MMDLILGFIIAGLLMAVEYLLCTKLKNPLWGGIIPVLLLAGSIFVFASGKVPFERNYLFPFVVVNTLFWGDWATGRDQYKKLKKAEMDRMKAKDM
ncbi:hypothetical protein E5329_15305 [Petralouisia muris]|jgi:hypothetical protein|uniref:Uncharacterized protein n=1 Tax=Petralouisia muris TaxID=3032872 RepID=A0AC61RUD6_9FIRM|nr:hypothetical protein [Petralouisia muris]MCI9614525.1 hypothetical protein [Dorea sp.]TGY95396.1 hypothetical protein E5329_15305 [Petralouisia muris]